MVATGGVTAVAHVRLFKTVVDRLAEAGELKAVACVMEIVVLEMIARWGDVVGITADVNWKGAVTLGVKRLSKLSISVRMEWICCLIAGGLLKLERILADLGGYFPIGSLVGLEGVRLCFTTLMHCGRGLAASAARMLS